MGVACKTCGFENPPEAQFCEHCGGGLTKEAADGVYCPTCGNKDTSGGSRCLFCGASFPALKTSRMLPPLAPLHNPEETQAFSNIPPPSQVPATVPPVRNPEVPPASLPPPVSIFPVIKAKTGQMFRKVRQLGHKAKSTYQGWVSSLQTKIQTQNNPQNALLIENEIQSKSSPKNEVIPSSIPTSALPHNITTTNVETPVPTRSSEEYSRPRKIHAYPRLTRVKESVKGFGEKVLGCICCFVLIVILFQVVLYWPFW